ncbi:MAG: ribose-phosphate pyrophosphokinase [Pseudomonadales bacterium]|nr:ribose-phosphate pyrophosphokinase [Candidatus Woesebacteria bacterium]MCB9800693.1 ribose-phosphate pyrophosphokinase [Pseudomonadales bacterium]
MKIITGSSHSAFAQSLQKHLGIESVAVDISTFSNGEKRVWIKDQLAGENVVFVQSFSHPTDENIMEFLLITDALERLGVRHVNAVIPWMGYSLQDKVFRTGEPIAAKVVADLVSNSYVKRVALLDLHNSSVPGFFSIPTQNLSANELFADYVKTNFGTESLVVASPDFGGLKRARKFADTLGVNLVNIDKHRNLATGEVSVNSMQGGSVEGKKVVVFDDSILSGNTVVEVSRLLKEKGASEVHILVTHGVFTDNALDSIQTDSIDSIVITNSISHESLPEKVTVVDASPLFAEVLNAWM